MIDCVQYLMLVFARVLVELPRMVDPACKFLGRGEG